MADPNRPAAGHAPTPGEDATAVIGPVAGEDATAVIGPVAGEDATAVIGPTAGEDATVVIDPIVAGAPASDPGGALRDWDGYAEVWSRLHGGYDLSQAVPVVRGWLRLGYKLATTRAVARLRPNAVTGVGLLLSLLVPVVAGWHGGWPVLAALAIVASALADTVDGALAVVSRRTSRLGYVYDSLADRISEAAWLVGFAVLGAAPWLVGLCGALAWLHEYLRARALASGMVELGAVTLGERPTRILVAAFALFFAGIGGLVSPELAVGTVTAAGAIWAMLQAVAFLQLLAAVHREFR